MKAIFKYFIGCAISLLAITIMLAAIVIYFFRSGDPGREYFDNSHILDSLNLSNEKYYELGGYLIYPAKKTVLVYRNNYTPCYIDTLVNFDFTVLVFYGNTIDFKEHLDSSIDYNTLKILHYNIGEDNRVSVCKDKNAVYKNGLTSNDKQDISALNTINDWIYQNDDDEIYYLTKNGELPRMQILDQKPYLPDLEYLSDRCFFNKDGLYQLQEQYYRGERFFPPVKIESSGGRKITPIMRKFYFIYDRSVYLLEDNSKWDKLEFQKLDLDATHLKEFIISDYDHSFILSDGKNTYVFPEKIRKKINTNSISRWIQLSDDKLDFWYKKRTNTLYYALNKNSESGESISMHGALINIDGNFWFINMPPNEEGKGEMFSVDKVMINTGNNYDYEELDIDSYRHISGDLYIYKGVLYRNLCQRIDGYKDLDLSNLHPLMHNGTSTEYYTDGKSLLYQNHIIKNVDLASLKVITERMLIDNHNIYGGTTVIPRDSLGVKVEVY